MADKTLNECNDKYGDRNPNVDLPSSYCGPDPIGQPYGSQKDVAADNVDQPPRRLGIGQAANCDPMQRSGWGLDDLRSSPSRETINRYSQAIRGCDEAMKDLFSDVTVTDDNGSVHLVPITVAPPEKAVAFILQENVRKDPSFVVDRIRLPLLSLYQSDIAMDMNRYVYHKAINYFRQYRPDQKPGWTISESGRDRDTVFGKARGIPVNISYQLNAWTLYKEDMNQILEQCYLKFSPVAYIRIQDVNYETIVKLDSTANNQEAEPGDKNVRVIKYQFNLTVETYIPQPIVRKKALLDLKIDILEAEKNEILDVLDKLEISTEE
jgi:hypothetical protein